MPRQWKAWKACASPFGRQMRGACPWSAISTAGTGGAIPCGCATAQAPDAPISIYEVHAGSWMRPEGEPNGTLDWRGLVQRLIPYVSRLGFTHVELLPIMEHPFGGSWGYQPLSQFAPSARYGTPGE